MSTNKKSSLVENVEHVFRAAAENRTGDCCMVAPSPELKEAIKKELAALRSSNDDGPLAGRIEVRERTAPGLNDGLIYPGDMFPAGTPLRVTRSAAADRAPLRGTVRVIVVLVDFSDKSMTATKKHFEDLFFSTGVLPKGSVREYFKEVTNGLVDIDGQVVGPYTLPLKLTEYAHGDSGTGSALPNARTMARDAAVKANPDVDFAPFDNDGDGFVDAFIVVHAGAAAESTGSVNDIWSHKWVLSGGSYAADTKNIYAYLTVAEDAKIGVCCHELGHLLFGFPDLYDTDYSGEGVGNWCLMGGGSWNGGGDIPAHPSAWCKANQGWASVTNQTTNATVAIKDVKTGRMIYRLWKDGAAGSEYFLVENRQKTLYDRELPSAGLLIWHVDESIAANSNEAHPKVALMQADGKRDLEKGNNRGDAGDPYPGSTGNVTFNKSSTPHSKSYAGVDTCVSVTDIGPSAATISARLSVKCVTKIKEIKEKERKEFKELKEKDKEMKEKDRKEVKEIKEFKEKELKEKDRKETKEKDRKEFKEFKEKDRDKPIDIRPGDFGGASQEYSDFGQEDLESRIMMLESRLAALEPFIDESLRPDLDQSALSAEEDLADLNTQMQQGAASAKRLFDTPQ